MGPSKGKSRAGPKRAAENWVSPNCVGWMSLDRAEPAHVMVRVQPADGDLTKLFLVIFDEVPAVTSPMFPSSTSQCFESP